MRRILSPGGVALLLIAVLFSVRLGRLPLTDPDEGRNAEVAREMLVSGSWIVPTYDGVPYLDKPALYFRTVAASFRAFGFHEWAARLPSVLSALALFGLLYAFCRGIWGGGAAALAVLVAAASPLVVIFARAVIFDMPLALFVSAAILAVFEAERRVGPPRTEPGQTR